MRKYLIDSLLARFDEKTRREIFQELCDVVGLAPRTMKRKIKALMYSQESLSSDQLLDVAKYFNEYHQMNLTISDLVNSQKASV